MSESLTGLITATLNRSHDSLGRPAGITLGSDYALTYAYAPDGRFSGVSWNISGIQDNAAYQYRANSHLIASLSLDSGAQTTYTYEPHRELKTSVSNNYGTTLISRYEYAHDAAGRRTAMTVTGDAFDGSAPSPPPDPEDALIPGTTLYTANALNQYTRIEANGDIQQPVYDADGNLTGDGHSVYVWNGENRLIEVEPGSPVDGDRRLEFVYDFMGRRVKKAVYAYASDQSPSWQLEREMVFVYDGWNLIEARGIAGGGPAPSSRYFVWGLDLSGAMQGAGGVGGLLAMVNQGHAYSYCYDANGNVGQVVDSADGSVAAHYEYAPFGKVIASMVI